MMSAWMVRGAAGVACFCALMGMVSLDSHAGQSRIVTQGVYADAQAARGEQIYKAQCVACHGSSRARSVRR
jgi:mono/diheme cytochrome c family protein